MNEVLPVITVTVKNPPVFADMVCSTQMEFPLSGPVRYTFATGARDVIIPVDDGKSAYRFYRLGPPLEGPTKAGDVLTYRRMGFIADFKAQDIIDQEGLVPPTDEEMVEIMADVNKIPSQSKKAIQWRERKRASKKAAAASTRVERSTAKRRSTQ